MSAFTKTEEIYIEHEVQLRVHDEKFTLLEKRLDKIDHKVNFIIGVALSAIIIPVALHYFNLI